jgi:hypothetical protein
MKSHEIAGMNRTFNYGFIDPYQINAVMVEEKLYADTTESRLLQYLEKNEYSSKILFPYNFK